jgi:NAD(P)-dependent dehydrogenase (short-subunit alcohol dehydrogenase family)
MSGRLTSRRRGSYGIDAPFAPAFLAALLILYLVLAIVTGRARFWLAFLLISAFEALFIHTALRGKFVVWAELLDGLRLRGDERILDLGCGRGAVLLMAAQHNDHGPGLGRGSVAKGRSVGQFRRGHPAQRRRRGSGGIIQAVLPGWRQRGSGVIVNVSSVGGRVSAPLEAAYNASKFALEAFTESLHVEVRHFGIRCVIIEPGNTAPGT